MPLVHSEMIEESSTLLLWKLTESEAELRSGLGSKYNFSDLNSITHPQKIREWLASRILLRTLAEEFGLLYEGTHKDEHGKVFLVNSHIHISLTHTFSYVAAVINPFSPVGIDMEKKDEKLQRTSRKYLSEIELNHAENDISNLCVYWCAKEALYKLYGKNGVSFREAIHIEEFSPTDVQINGKLSDNGQSVDSRIYLRWIENHCLAVAVTD